MKLLALEELHDIAPPVDYWILNPWVVAGIVTAALLLVAIAAWLIRRWRRRPARVLTPRERALERLQVISAEAGTADPHVFSIQVSDILRSYVTEQFHVPLTRQTSIEFLNAVAGASTFSADEQALLGDFLNRCDLIKFANVEATHADSRALLEEANRFVQGGALAPA